ncbi:unnamed protein product, partial [marine sediment metagenome]
MSTDYTDKLRIKDLERHMTEVQKEQDKLRAALEELRDQLIKHW